jgi:hypothetical protein
MRLFLKGLLAIPLTLIIAGLTGCFPTESPTDSLTDKPVDKPVVTSASVDSMFNLLITRVERLENVDKPSQVYAIEFRSLQDGFSSAVSTNQQDIKANVGLIVSTVLSLNANSSIQKMIDSLNNYMQGMDNYYSSTENMPLGPSALKKKKAGNRGILSKSFKEHGLLLAGQTMLAQSPKIVLAQTGRPDFPRFITASYVQQIIENDVLPRLDQIIEAAERLTRIADMNCVITVEDEKYELDNGDIYMFQALAKAARAGFTMMLCYDFDIYSPDGSNNMGWIDSLSDFMDNIEIKSLSRTFSLKADTIIENRNYDMSDNVKYPYSIYRYNLNRPGFLSIRRQFHSKVYADLKDIPLLIKTGLNEINNEIDNQDNDIIKSLHITDMTADMVDMKKLMEEEGITPELASKFQSPQSLMDFITLILTQPYTFNQTIDGKNIKMTFDLSKFFTNPAASLKEYMPKFRMPSEADSKYTAVYTYNSDYSFGSKYIYYSPNDNEQVIINIPDSLIVSRTATQFTLKYPIHCRQYVDSMKIIKVLEFIDDNNQPVNVDEMLSSNITKESLAKGFPYYADYTFKGMFPEMTTRQKWIDFFGIFVD